MSTIISCRNRDIVHMDLETFFVSVERVLDPALNKRPVIVDGKPLERVVVAGCSYEARTYGVHSAMPLRTAFRLCPEAVFLRGHYVHYAEYSNLATEILTNIAPMVIEIVDQKGSLLRTYGIIDTREISIVTQNSPIGIYHLLLRSNSGELVVSENLVVMR